VADGSGAYGAGYDSMRIAAIVKDHAKFGCKEIFWLAFVRLSVYKTISASQVLAKVLCE